MFYFFLDLLLMHGLNFFFYQLLNYYNIKEKFLGNISFNLTRSIICGSLSYYAYKNYSNVWNDMCLLDKSFNFKLIIYHNSFLNYFIYDLFVMIYQVYKKINNQLRKDLLFHHLLAIFAMHVIEQNKMFHLSLLIGLSEGMSFVSGFKLLCNKLELKKINQFIIIYRLSYLIFIRMIFLWPSLIYFYISATHHCDNFKNNSSISLLLLFLGIILYNEFSWIKSGLKELKRI